MDALRIVFRQPPALDPATAHPVVFSLPHLCLAIGGLLLAQLLLQTLGQAIARLFGLPRRIIPKFAHAYADLCYYTYSVLTLTRLLWSATWAWPGGWHELMLDGRVQQVPELAPYTAPADLQRFHLMETSFYLSSFFLLLARPRKKDFAQMALHHVVTASLLMLSYHTGYLRVGAVVMYLHNIFDPFLLLAKCTHYAKLPVLPDVAFALCAVAFAVPRLVFYPRVIYHAWRGVCTGTPTCPGGVWDKTPIEFALVGLLVALVPIHVFWFAMILKVLWRAWASKGVQGDVRSDSEDDGGAELAEEVSQLRYRQQKTQ
jgi:hypothetical protein